MERRETGKQGNRETGKQGNRETGDIRQSIEWTDGYIPVRPKGLMVRLEWGTRLRASLRPLLDLLQRMAACESRGTAWLGGLSFGTGTWISSPVEGKTKVDFHLFLFTSAHKLAGREVGRQ